MMKDVSDVIFTLDIQCVSCAKAQKGKCYKVSGFA
jgi:hypothetical protein